MKCPNMPLHGECWNRSMPHVLQTVRGSLGRCLRRIWWSHEKCMREGENGGIRWRLLFVCQWTSKPPQKPAKSARFALFLSSPWKLCSPSWLLWHCWAQRKLSFYENVNITDAFTFYNCHFGPIWLTKNLRNKQFFAISVVPITEKDCTTQLTY